MDRTSIIGIAVCVVFYLGYEQYLSSKYPERFKKTAQTEMRDNAKAPSSVVSESLSQETSPNQSLKETSHNEVERSYKKLSDADLTVETETSTLVFNQETGGLDSVVLKNFKNDSKTEVLQLLDSPLQMFGAVRGGGQPKGFRAHREGEYAIAFSREDGNWELNQFYRVDPKSFAMDVTFTWKNLSSSAQNLVSEIHLREKIGQAKITHSFFPGIPTVRPSLVASISGETTWYDVKEACEGEANLIAKGSDHSIDFIGFDKHYFLQVVMPAGKRMSYSINRMAAKDKNDLCDFGILSYVDQGSVPSLGSASITMKSWFGPKDTRLFAGIDDKLDDSVDLGFFGPISKVLLSALRFVFDFVGNWGVAIILLTLLLKVLFYPLTRQAAVSMHRMKKLQPEMNRLKEKHKDDPRRQQQELMQFMAAQKVNPMKGCLPILPQIPVFFAFYRVLSASIELRHAPFFGWIQDLSVNDPYYITPVLLGAAMVAQQKLTPTTGMDKTQEKIMLMLPLFFAVMMLTLPAGLVLYVLTNTIVSIAQQQWLNKRLG